MQKVVLDFISKYNLHCDEKIRYIDLVSEIGELGKEVVKGYEYGKKEYSKTPNSIEEMGDCLFSLLALCCEMDIDAESALKEVLKKYEKRFNNKGEISSGL